jgi:hypothetical protein
MRIHRDPTRFLNKLLLPELRELFLVDDDNCAGMNIPPMLAQYPLELLSIDGYLIYDIGKSFVAARLWCIWSYGSVALGP